jgi:ubiquinone/menaquinone biosynthesis C-methylase UbiE
VNRDPRAILDNFRQGGPSPSWAIDPALATSPGIQARDRSAAMIAGMSVDQAAVLNGCLGPTDMQRLTIAARNHLLDAPLSGIGIELGAGLGVLSSTIAQSDEVQGVIAVEICANFVNLVIPVVASLVLGNRARRVVPTLGSFDALELDDESVDFAVEIDSLHHAEDLDAVLAECARVLKPGACLVSFDRAQPNEMPDWLRERMLDHEYSDRWIEENGYPPGVQMTRRENGEHEIRLREWTDAFTRAGFRLARVVNFVSAITPKLAGKAAISYLPTPLRRRLIAMPVPRDYFTAWLRTRLAPTRDAVGSVVFAPKFTTGMLAYRQPA